MKKVIMMATNWSTIGKCKAFAMIAIVVPSEVIASDKLSFAAASSALECAFFAKDLL